MGRELHLVAEGFRFLECPRWHDGRLWVSDFYDHRVMAIGADGHVETVVEVDEQPAGLGWLPGGDLLVASMKDRRILRHDGTGLVEHADLFDLARAHLNDMTVDRHGRAYVGSFGSDVQHGEPVRPAPVIRVDPDGSARVVADDVLFPNGTVITPDGRTMIMSESFANRLIAFDVEPDGALANRRPWATFGEVPATTDMAEVRKRLDCMPDGMTLDAEGAVWVADAIGCRVVRVSGGEIVEEISTRPLGRGVFACALGGSLGRTLFLCTVPAEVRGRPAQENGRLLAVEVDVPHAGLP